MDNKTIAAKLCQMAKQLEKQNDNLFRIRAYRSAAQLVLAMTKPVADIVQTKGVQGLRELPGIGDHIAYAIERLVTMGDYYPLADTAMANAGEDVRSLPGIGPRFAQSLWEKYRIRTTGELEEALREDYLTELGIGRKRRANWLRRLRESKK